jgi:hypothetical protein
VHLNPVRSGSPMGGLCQVALASGCRGAELRVVREVSVYRTRRPRVGARLRFAWMLVGFPGRHAEMAAPLDSDPWLGRGLAQEVLAGEATWHRWK